MYEIVNVQYTGTYNNGGTSIPAVLGEFRASSAADLPAQNADCHIICGCDGLDIATGDRYIWNGAAWILQPKENAFTNVYTKAEIDTMSNVLYQTMMYYHATQESTDGTITFYTFGEPVGSLTIYGNGSQSGTPTPDNPVIPEFVGVETAQLLDIKDGTRTINNVVWTAYHGTITANGTTTAVNESDAVIVYDGTFARSGNYVNYSKIQASKSIKPPAGTYTFSANANPSDSGRIALIVGADDAYFANSSARKIAVGETFSVNGNEYVMLVVSSIISINQYNFSDIMLSSGSTPLPYEPYGWAEKITCAGQTTPVYLGQVSTVRRIKKLVLTGQEAWMKYTNYSAKNCYKLEVSGMMSSAAICTHYPNTTVLRTLIDNDGMHLAATDTWVIHDSRFATEEDLKQWLQDEYAAGTPVTVWYVRATPETGIVNEPLAKIGDYADELSSADAGVSIPTVKGSNVLTVETTLPPSKIVISGRDNHE